jgi:hypothetical protein
MMLHQKTENKKTLESVNLCKPLRKFGVPFLNLCKTLVPRERGSHDITKELYLDISS